MLTVCLLVWKINCMFSQKIVNDRLIALSEKHKLPLILFYMEDMTYQEIADYLEISPKTVDNHLQKALKLLKDKLSLYKEEFYN